MLTGNQNPPLKIPTEEDAFHFIVRALRDTTARLCHYGYEVYMEDSMPDTEANREKLIKFIAQEIKKDFYAELPIKIRLTGSYHDFGAFISGIAALPIST